MLVSTEALATIAAPDSPPTITSIHANHNLAETDDAFFYGQFNIPYASLPSVDNVTIPADQLFIFRLMTADGETELGNGIPFSHPDFGYGYNKGIVGLYFPASANVSWGASYLIRISQNPTYFESPAYVDMTVSPSAYSSELTQAENRADLATRLYQIARSLEPVFNKTLFQTSGSRMVLTSDGEVYLRGAIPGVQGLAPAIFLIQQVPADTTTDNWTTAQFEAYEQRFEDTWVGPEAAGVIELVGGSADPNALNNSAMIWFILLIVPMCVFWIIISMVKLKRVEPGFLCASLTLLMAVLMGWMPRALFATIYQACGIYTAFLIFYARG